MIFFQLTIAVLTGAGLASALTLPSLLSPAFTKHRNRPWSGKHRNASQACAPGRVIAPDLVTLRDSTPDRHVSEPTDNVLALSLSTKGHNQDQVALFRGIPPGAKRCYLGWKQRKVNTPETFKTFGNALVEYHVLPGSHESWTYTEIEESADKQTQKSTIDFTMWDKPSFSGSRYHRGGTELKCDKDINIAMRISSLNGRTGGLYQEGMSEREDEDLQQGVYIEWEC